MAGIFSRRDVVGEFLGLFGGHFSAGSRRPRLPVDDCRSRPEDSAPESRWFHNQEQQSSFYPLLVRQRIPPILCVIYGRHSMAGVRFHSLFPKRHSSFQRFKNI